MPAPLISHFFKKTLVSQQQCLSNRLKALGLAHAIRAKQDAHTMLRIEPQLDIADAA